MHIDTNGFLIWKHQNTLNICREKDKQVFFPIDFLLLHKEKKNVHWCQYNYHVRDKVSHTFKSKLDHCCFASYLRVSSRRVHTTWYRSSLELAISLSMPADCRCDNLHCWNKILDFFPVTVFDDDFYLINPWYQVVLSS